MPSAREQESTKLIEFRRITANVLAELRSQEIRDSYAAVTMTEVIDQALQGLVGDGKKLGRKQKLTKVRDEFYGAIDAIKNTPPSTFRFPDPEQDVNTPPEPAKNT